MIYLGIIENLGRLVISAVGQDLSIACLARPIGLPVMWHKEVNTGSDGVFVEISDPRVSYEPTDSQSTLRISNVTLSDDGRYRCSGAAPPFDTQNATYPVVITPGLFCTYTVDLCYCMRFLQILLLLQ